MIPPPWPPVTCTSTYHLLRQLLYLPPPDQPPLCVFPEARWPALRTAARALVRLVVSHQPPPPISLCDPWPVAVMQIFSWWARQTDPGCSTAFTYMASVAALLRPAAPWLGPLPDRLSRVYRVPSQLSPKYHHELTTILRSGLCSHLRHVLAAPPQSLSPPDQQWWALAHRLCRWTGIRATDLRGGTVYIPHRHDICLTLLRHKKKRFGTQHVRLPRSLLSHQEITMLERHSGHPWPVQDRTLWYPLADHETWRRARVVELSPHMTLHTLQQFMNLRKSIHIYLRGLPTASQDHPQRWWPQPQQ